MTKNLTRRLIYFMVLIIPAYSIRFAVFGIPTNVLEILTLLILVLYLANNKCSFFEFYKENKIYVWSILAIFAGLVISVLTSGDYWNGFGIIKGWFVVPLIFAWVLYEQLKTSDNLEMTLKWLYAGISGVAVVSLVYYFFGNLTYDGRLEAFYGSPNYLAMFIAPGIFMGIYLINLQLKTKNLQPNIIKLFFTVAGLLALFAAIYLTYSYATWAAIILSLAVIVIIKNKKISRLTFLVGLIIVLLIIISQWNTEKLNNLRKYTRSPLESRIMIWQSAGKILADNPVLGIGPGNFQNKYLEYQKYFPLYLEWAVPQPHNLYLAFWLESGLAGIIGFIVLIAKWLADTIKIASKQKSSLSFLAAILFGTMLYILIHGLVDTPYWKNDLALVFWIIITLGLSVKKLEINSI
jgi:O-antigen ligase